MTWEELSRLGCALPHFITDHYRGYPAVLARLAALGPGEAALRLELAWRTKAPKTLICQLDAAMS